METNNIKSQEKNQHLSWIINIFNILLTEYGANPAQCNTVFSLLAISQGRISFKTYKSVIATQIFKSQKLIDETAEIKQGFIPYSSQYVTRRLDSISNLENKKGVKILGCVYPEIAPGENAKPLDFTFQMLQDANNILNDAKQDSLFPKSPIKTLNKYALNFALKAIKESDEVLPSKEEIDAQKRQKKVEEAEKIEKAIDDIEEVDRLEKIYEHSARLYKLYHSISQKTLKKISALKNANVDLSLRSTGKPLDSTDIKIAVSSPSKEDVKLSTKTLVSDDSSSISSKNDSKNNAKSASKKTKKEEVVVSQTKENSSANYFAVREQEKKILKELDSIPLEKLEKKYELKNTKEGSSNSSNFTVEKDGVGIDAITVEKDGNESLISSIDEVVLGHDVLSFMDAFWQNGMKNFDITCPVMGKKDKSLFWRKGIDKEASLSILKEAFLIHASSLEKTAIYLTPHFSEDIQIIKLDDVKAHYLNATEGVPCFVTQTSLEKFQVWFLIQGKAGERIVLKSNLIQRFNSDERDAGINGRIPDSINYKYEVPFKTKNVKNDLALITPMTLIEKGLIPSSYLEREAEKIRLFEEQSKKSRLRETPPFDKKGNRVWPSLAMEISRAPLVQEGKRKGQPDRSFAYSRWAWIALQRGFPSSEVIEELSKICEKRSTPEKRMAYSKMIVEKALKNDPELSGKSLSYRD